MKVVINTCFGGFSLSAKATKRLAELEGKECYFFVGGLNEPYKEIPIEETRSVHCLMWVAFSVKNPSDILPENREMKDNLKFNKIWETIYITNSPDDRTNPNLIKVVEELNEEANGTCADLKVVVIPDGVEYEIYEYDGNESVHEKHRSWY
jgi:hypothetical protein